MYRVIVTRGAREGNGYTMITYAEKKEYRDPMLAMFQVASGFMILDGFHTVAEVHCVDARTGIVQWELTIC